MFVQLRKNWLGDKPGAVNDLSNHGDADLLIKGSVAEAERICTDECGG